MVRRNRGYKNLGHWESLIALGVVWVCHSLDTSPPPVWLKSTQHNRHHRPLLATCTDWISGKTVGWIYQHKLNVYKTRLNFIWMILKAQMQTVGDSQRWYASDRYGLLITVGGVGCVVGDFSQNRLANMALLWQAYSFNIGPTVYSRTTTLAY